MSISARAALMAGVATVTASAVLVAPSVQPLPPPKPTIQLAADVQLTAQPADYFSQLADWWQPIFWPSASETFPPPPNIGPSPTPAGFEDAIISTYHAIEPWVEWGFQVATYAVGWIPWVGWLSGQIMIFYYFGERIVESLVENSANWLWGPLPFLEGLGNIAWDSWDALVQLGRDQLHFWLPSLPPLPPIPCIFRCNNLSELNAPLDAIRVSLRDTVDALLRGLLHDPDESLPGVTTDVVPGFTPNGSDVVAEVSRVPETVINFLNPAAAAKHEVAGTVPDVPPGPKTPRRVLRSLVEVPGNILKGAVAAQGEVRGAAAEATADDSKSTFGRAHGPVGEVVSQHGNHGHKEGGRNGPRRHPHVDQEGDRRHPHVDQEGDRRHPHVDQEGDRRHPHVGEEDEVRPRIGANGGGCADTAAVPVEARPPRSAAGVGTPRCTRRHHRDPGR